MLQGLGSVSLVAVMLGAAIVTPPPGQGLQPGDMVYVEVYRHPELSTTTQVAADGTVELPYAGRVTFAGQTETQASATAAQALLAVLRNPRVSVSRGGGAMPVLGARTAEMRTEFLQLNNSGAGSLSHALQAMTSEGGNVSYHEETNTLIITDTETAIRNMLAVAQQLDEMQSQITQVRIDALVAEVEEQAAKEIGVRWWVQDKQFGGGYYPMPRQDVNLNALHGQGDVFANEQVGGASSGSSSAISNSGRRFVDGMFDRRLNVPVQVPTPGQSFFSFVGGSVDVGAMMDALVAEDRAELLASPYVLAVNHSQAEIDQTIEFPYTEFGTEVTGRSTFSTRFLELGIRMTVTPHVLQDEVGPYVRMELEPEVSFPVGSSNGIPIRSVRRARTKASVRDGQTLIIGGIYRYDQNEIEQRMPGLGKLPVLGTFFKRKENSNVRTELMIFVTPTIHEKPESVTWDRMVAIEGLTEDGRIDYPLLEAGEEKRRD
jgi:type IV pilus assembly protein PilQ